MAEKPEINLTLYESAKTIRATEKEFQVKWALDYLNEHAQNGRLSITLFEMYYLNLLNSVVYAEAANDTWKLEKNQFVNTTNSYLRKFRSPNIRTTLSYEIPVSGTSLLNESNARNWNETIQKTVNYGECDGLLFVVESPHSFVLSTSTGCTVLNKYTEWKWKNRTELDLLAIKQLNDVDMETGSKNHKNRGFDYKVAKEKYSHAQRMKKICLDNAWDKCLLAVKANLEYEQVKDTNSSSMKKEILEKKERSLKKALVLEPIERVNTVVELMESEVEYNIGAC
ncbi:secretory glycoprotein k5-like protein [Schistosoma japonicum]|nr:secretory glycoprotein k5-like protein [Schistosoma japonicum]